jgi:hypothetical protein
LLFRCATALLAIITFGPGRPAAAQTFSWNNPAGGNWNVGSNWSTGTVPGAGQNALIDLTPPDPYTVSLTDNRSIAAVTVNAANVTLAQSAGDLTASGPFNLQAGTMHLTGGRILANGGFTSATGTTIRLDGGQLWGNILFGGSVTLNGTLDWSAGELHGPGSTTATFAMNGPVNLIGTGTREIESRGLTRLNGGGTWDAGRLIVDAFTQNFELPAGATITNTTASGNFRLDGDGSVGSVFNLRGTFVKQGVNESMFWQTRVNNSGLLDVQAGTMRFWSSGTHTGTFQVASGATLEFNGQEDLNSFARLTVSGTGVLEVGQSGRLTVASTASVNIASTATVRVVGGIVDLPTTVTLSPNALEVSGPTGFGRLTVRGVTNPNNLTMRTGGEIWGGGQGGVNNDLSVGGSGGTFTWEGGQFAFLRNVTVFGPANLPGTGHRELVGNIASGVTLNITLRGVSTWDAGTLELNGRSGITIPAGATATITTTSGNFSVVPPDATADGGFISVQGTLIKLGTNTATFGRDIDVGGTGHFDIRAGTVVVSTELRDGARYTIAPGATLDARVKVNVWGSTRNGVLEGSGTVITPTVALDFGGRIRPGMGGPGVLTIGGNSFVNITAHDDTLGGPPRLVIATERTGPGTANSGRIEVTGTGKINFNFPGTIRLVELELVGTGLHAWETYTLDIATAGGGFQRNTSFPNLAAGYEFPTTDYRVIHNYPGLQDVRLFLRDANTLSLQFTPIPEPTTIIGIAAGALGLGGLIRRRLAGKRKPATVG